MFTNIYLNVQLCISNYTLYIVPTTTEAGDNMLNVLFGTPCNQVYLDLCTNKRVYSRQTCLHQDSGRSRTVYMYIVRHSNVALKCTILWISQYTPHIYKHSKTHTDIHCTVQTLIQIYRGSMVLRFIERSLLVLHNILDILCK